MRSFISHTISIPTNGIRLHVEAAGPRDGPLVIFLHGFPEYWMSFAGQFEPLARSGFFVIAPDQRGYNLSDKPAGIQSYRIEELTKDILGLIDYFSREKAVIIGHDWGAAVAWKLAIQNPGRVERLGILNVPHPAALAHAFTSPVWAQLRKSWYIYFFQIPGLPERILRLGNYAGMRSMLRASSQPGTFSKEELRRLTQTWNRPGALTAMLNWYRAEVRRTLQRGREGYLADAAERVHPPTLILWGEQDIALIPELAQWSLEWCDQGELVRFPKASHWVQHEEPERVANRLLDFLEDLRTST